ncbi:AI-2E family transporter [Segetibacter sp. 3557_3]|uniref:AI-2E family transporter n=1 Tax=Segetibacter sp. 3557_3 TaxID=2547429 RepID=UPI001058A13B|nr:AI-2E family transporter [Segetibacter sp. 3557_3]TDH28593.1 AI-2E family transporter [Segetibacter sp. 3557_3]
MIELKHQKVFKAAAILAILVLIVVILVYAKSFLVPLTFAAILSMLLLPVTKWLQSKGVNHAVAIISSILVLVSFFGLVIFFVSYQVADIAGNTAKIEQQFTSKYHQLQQFTSEKLGISPDKQQQMLKEQQSSSQGKTSSMITGLLAGLGGFLTDSLLVLVYIFLFIYFRGRLKGFIIRLVPKEQEGNAVEIVDGSQKVSQQYLTGMFFMIVCLWVMYFIGFSIVGVKNAIFFAILCGVLEIVPFVGNLFGTALTLIMSLAQGGGGSNLIIGILITYAVVQFLQSYILEPMIVGAEVSINPLFTIVGLIAGETLWGIAGMVLAIPLLGMAKIVFDHVESLKPYGYLVGQDKEEEESGMKQKLKGLTGKLKTLFRK